METLDVRRRKVTASADHETAGARQDVETALSPSFVVGHEASQASSLATREVPAPAMRNPMEASPGMMERGQGSGSLIASPFHSEKVKSELELRRHRPLTLDADARKVSATVEEQGELQHGFHDVGESARVARVETREDTARRMTGEPSPRGSFGPGATAGGDAAIGPPQSVRVARECEEAELDGGFTPREDGLALALVATEPGLGRPCPQDNRELVPAGSNFSEDLLERVMEENRLLKMRLEQVEAGYGWFGQGLTTGELAQHSPMSFGPEEVRGALVQSSHFRTASEGLLGVGSNPQGVVSGCGSTSGYLEKGWTLPPEPRGEPISFGPATDPLEGPSEFLRDRLRGRVALNSVGPVAREENGRMAPPVPRLPLGNAVGDGSSGPMAFTGSQAKGKGVGLSGDLRRELEAMGLEVVPRRLVGREGLEFSGLQQSSGESSVPSQDLRFQTPRSSVQDRGSVGFDAHGYPISPGRTVIRPPPLPPPVMGDGLPVQATAQTVGAGLSERPEEPAKYIYEIPKLGPPELANSAVTCGNWLAQVRQILVGLSPSAGVWWSAVEQAANYQYQRWLTADPLDRLMLDPSSVIASFDKSRYQRVESRAVTLVLAAIPTNLRDEAVSNRWLSTASLLFRMQCVYQPGGSSERSMLLSQLVSPEIMKTCGGAVATLRRWLQHFHRVQELQATLPDSSLLLKGIDGSTASFLAQYPALNFRVSSFRNRASLDYNPSVTTVLQLVRLLQAEFEAASLNVDVQGGDKRARNAAAQVASLPEGPRTPATKAPPGGPPPDPMAKALTLADGKGKGKGKDKGKEGAKEMPLCHGFNNGTGCKYGDVCRFMHDRAAARRQKRCLACGQEGHFRPECSLVSEENRRVLQGEPSVGIATNPKAPVPKKPSLAKAKGAPVVKGMVEDSGAPSASSGSGNQGVDAGSQVQEALLAEAAKILKGVSLKACKLPKWDLATEEEPGTGLDLGWLVSAVASASDPTYALVDSGATNALRQAKEGEISAARVIQVDLASGAAELHISRHGTLLSLSLCQVILPAGYLVQLGYSISWKRKGCVIQRAGQAPLEVKVVKGCPLIPKEVGLRLLDEYESMREVGGLVSLNKVMGDMGPSQAEARRWLAHKVAQGRLSELDQLMWLRSVFPHVPDSTMRKVVKGDVDPSNLSMDGVPWNRRMRRSIPFQGPAVRVCWFTCLLGNISGDAQGL